MFSSRLHGHHQMNCHRDSNPSRITVTGNDLSQVRRTPENSPRLHMHVDTSAFWYSISRRYFAVRAS